MPYLLVRHNVADYDAWKPGFDDHGPARSAHTSQGGHVFRSADDPNEVFVLLKFGDLDQARTFASSEDLREKMQEVGVVGRPDIYFIEEAARPDA